MPSGDALEDFELTQEEATQLQAGPVEEPAPAAEPPVEEPPAQPPVQPQPQKMVPLAALHQARMEARELKQRLEAVEALKNEFVTLREQLKPPPPPGPSIEEDPFGALNHKINQIQQQSQQREEALLQAAVLAEQDRKANEQLAFVNQRITAQEQAYRTQTPDFDDALMYLARVKGKEFEVFGVTDPVAIDQKLREIAFTTAAQLELNGYNHAEVFYNMAKAYGYQPRQSTPQAAQEPTLDQQFAAIQRGQQQAQTIRGGETAIAPSVKALLEADDDEFDTMWNQVMLGKKK